MLYCVVLWHTRSGATLSYFIHSHYSVDKEINILKVLSYHWSSPKEIAKSSIIHSELIFSGKRYSM